MRSRFFPWSKAASSQDFSFCPADDQKGQFAETVHGAEVSSLSVPEIIPEGIDALVRMECPQRIGPALGDEAPLGVADFRPE
jgi:hypothetical protein